MLQEARGGSKRLEEAPGGSRKLQETPGGSYKLWEAPGGSKGIFLHYSRDVDTKQLNGSDISIGLLVIYNLFYPKQAFSCIIAETRTAKSKKFVYT